MRQGGGAIVTCEACRDAVPGWLELRDLTLPHGRREGTPVGAVRPRRTGSGTGSTRRPRSSGKVGDPPKGRSLTRGYLELRTRAFYRTDTSARASRRWIEGSRDDDSGGFFPAASVVLVGAVTDSRDRRLDLEAHPLVREEQARPSVAEAPDAVPVWVSEVMLQQTTADVVARRFDALRAPFS